MINTNTFVPAESRWQDIFLHLQNDGFDVYPPATKVGECVKAYIVLKYDGGSRIAGISSNDDVYSVICHVPKQLYSTLELLVQRIKKSMKELEPMILPYGNQSPSYYDDSIKAHSISIQYKNHKKML